jgi:hypothetical protein
VLPVIINQPTQIGAVNNQSLGFTIVPKGSYLEGLIRIGYFGSKLLSTTRQCIFIKATV